MVFPEKKIKKKILDQADFLQTSMLTFLLIFITFIYLLNLKLPFPNSL